MPYGPTKPPEKPKETTQPKREWETTIYAETPAAKYQVKIPAGFSEKTRAVNKWNQQNKSIQQLTPGQKMVDIRAGQGGRIGPKPEYPKILTLMDVKQDWLDNYWQDPLNVARYKNFIDTAPPDWQPPEWMDVEAINAAYRWFEYRNDGKPWQQWKRLPEDDPAQSFLQFMQIPDAEHAFPGQEKQIKAILDRQQEYYQQQQQQASQSYDPYAAMGYTPVSWQELPFWQRMITSLWTPQQGIEGRPESSRLLASGVQGIMAALPAAMLTSAVLSPIGGAIAGGIAFGETAYRSYTGNYIPGLSDLLQVFNIPELLLEQGIGIISQVEAEGLDAVTRDLPAAWKAAGLTYETMTPQLMNLVAGIAGDETAQHDETWYFTRGYVDPVPLLNATRDDIGPRGQEALAEARERISAGEDPNLVYADFYDRFGDSATFNEFISGTILDPLNVMPMASGFLGEGVAKALNDPRMAVAFKEGRGNIAIDMLPFGVQQLVSAVTKVKGSEGILGSLKMYAEDVRTGTWSPAALEMLPKDSQGLPIIRSANELTNVERAFSGITKGGEYKNLQPAREDISGINKFLTSMRELTPDSKASIFLQNLSENIGHILFTSDNPAASTMDRVNTMRSTLEQYAGVRAVEVGSTGEMFLKSPLTATTSIAVKDFVGGDVYQGMTDNFMASQPKIAMLESIAKIVGMDKAKVVEALAEDYKTFHRMFYEKLKASDNPMAKELLADIQQGHMTAEMLSDTLAIFTGVDSKGKASPPQPWDFQDYQARVMNSMFDSSAAFLSDHFGIKTGSVFYRMANVLKSAQSMLLLDLNPGYLINNVLNNWVTRASQGVFGFMTTKQIDAWVDRFGITPARFTSSDTPAAIHLEGAERLGDYLTKFREETMGDGALAKLQKQMNQARYKFGVMSKLSSKMERSESRQAYTIGMQKMWNKLWKPGEGYTKMPGQLVAQLAQIDPKLPDFLDNTIRSGMNIGEIERNLFVESVKINADRVMREAAQQIAPTDPDSYVDAMKTTGLGDEIAKRLAGAKSMEDIDRVFDAVKDKVQDSIDQMTLQEVITKAEEVSTQVQAEGFQAALGMFSDAQVKIWQRWMTHFNEVSDLVERTNYLPFDQRGRVQRNTEWRSQNARESREWGRIQDLEYQTYSGIIDTLGIDNPATAKYLDAVSEQHTAWRDFYDGYDIDARTGRRLTAEQAIGNDNARHVNGKNDILREHFSKDFANGKEAAISWRAATEQIQTMSNAAYDAEFAASNKMAGMFADMFEEFGGDRTLAENWRREVSNIREEMRQSMAKHRKDVAKLDADARAEAWAKYIESEYKPLITKLKTAEIMGARNLKGKAPEAEAPAPAPKPGEPTAPAAPVETAPAIPEVKVPDNISTYLRNKLREVGYTSEQVKAMTPQEAWGIWESIKQSPEAEQAKAHGDAKYIQTEAMQRRLDAQKKQQGLINKKIVMEQAKKAFNLTDPEASAVELLMDLHAERWAEQVPGRLPEEWYQYRIAQIGEGETPDNPGELYQATQFDFTQREQQNRWYFSRARKTVEGLQLGKDLNQQGEIKAGRLLKILENQASGEELQYTGLKDYLKRLKADERISQAEVLEYLDANQVIVDEVLRGPRTDVEDVSQNVWQERAKEARITILKLDNELARTYNEVNNAINFLADTILDYQMYEPLPDGFSQNRIANKQYLKEVISAVTTENILPDNQIVEGRKTGEYEPYFDYIDNLRKQSDWEYSFEEVKRYYVKADDISKQRKFMENQRDYYDKQMESILPTRHSGYQEPGGTNYRELLFTYPHSGEAWKNPGHWSEDNVLAWMRFNDRVDADGKKTLFIEELQSDWHQKGREKGYVVPGEIERLREEVNTLSARYDKLYSDIEKHPEYIALREKAEQAQNNYLDMQTNFGYDIEIRRKYLISDPDHLLLDFNDKIEKTARKLGYSDSLIDRAKQKLEELVSNDLISDRDRITGEQSEFWSSYFGGTDIDINKLYSQIWDGQRKYLNDSLQKKNIALIKRNQAQDILEKKHKELFEANTELKEAERLYNEANRRYVDKEERGIPDAPFKGSDWQALALKRAMSWAVENGYDKVAWTTGEQQIKRWSQQVRDRFNRLEYDGNILNGFDNDGSRIFSQEVPPKDLALHVGGEMAKVLLQTGEVEGDNITVGGAGMRQAYDVTMPDIAKKLIKRYGGEMGEVSLQITPTPDTVSRPYRLMRNTHNGWELLFDFETAEQAQTYLRSERNIYPMMELRIDYEDSKPQPKPNIQPGFEITPKMREVIQSEGQALLQDNAADSNIKGSTYFLNDGRAVIKAMQSADVSTLVHEIGHVFRRDLPTADLDIMAKWAGMKDAAEMNRLEKLWQTNNLARLEQKVSAGAADAYEISVRNDLVKYRDAEEMFARGWERYLAEDQEGMAGIPVEVRSMFKRFSDWLVKIYKRIRGSQIDVDMTDEMRGVFDRLLFKDEEAAMIETQRNIDRNKRKFADDVVSGRTAKTDEQDAWVIAANRVRQVLIEQRDVRSDGVVALPETLEIEVSGTNYYIDTRYVAEAMGAKEVARGQWAWDWQVLDYSQRVDEVYRIAKTYDKLISKTDALVKIANAGIELENSTHQDIVDLFDTEAVAAREAAKAKAIEAKAAEELAAEELAEAIIDPVTSWIHTEIEKSTTPANIRRNAEAYSNMLGGWLGEQEGPVEYWQEGVMLGRTKSSRGDFMEQLSAFYDQAGGTRKKGLTSISDAVEAFMRVAKGEEKQNRIIDRAVKLFVADAMENGFDVSTVNDQGMKAIVFRLDADAEYLWMRGDYQAVLDMYLRDPDLVPLSNFDEKGQLIFLDMLNDHFSSTTETRLPEGYKVVEAPIADRPKSQYFDGAPITKMVLDAEGTEIALMPDGYDLETMHNIDGVDSILLGLDPDDVNTLVYLSEGEIVKTSEIINNELYQKKRNKQQPGFFDESAEDLPLFSGSTQAAKDEVFRMKEQSRQGFLFQEPKKPAITRKLVTQRIGNFDYFVRDGNLYKARVDSPTDVDGYPMGARFEAPGHMVNEALRIAKQAAGMPEEGTPPNQLFQQSPPPDSPEFKAWFGDSKVTSEDDNPLPVYHGSPNQFQEFKYDFMGKTGTSEGFGFYFTNNEKLAGGYTEGSGNLYEAYLNIRKPLNESELTLTKAQVTKFLKALDPDGQGYLSNHGDTEYEGYNNVLRKAVAAEMDFSDNDVDLLGSIINAEGGDVEGVYKTLKKTLGYDGIIKHADDETTIYIPFLPEQIKSTSNRGTWDATDRNIFNQVEPVGEMPFGTTPDSLKNGEIMDEFDATTMKNYMDVMRSKAKQQVGQRGVQDYNIPEATTAEIRKYLKTVERDMASTKRATLNYGTQMRDMSLLNYDKRYGMDNLLNIVYPYQLWYTRSMINWAQRMIDKPQWFSMYARMKEMQRRQEVSTGMSPTRLNGKARMAAPWLPDWAGGILYSDPLRQLFPIDSLFGQQLTGMQMERSRQQQQTYTILQEQRDNGQITKDQYSKAAENQSGADWDRAWAQAAGEIDSKAGNPLGLVELMMGKALYLDIPQKLLTGKAEEISPMPITRTASAIQQTLKGTKLEGVGNIIGSLAAPERWARKKMGLSEFGQWGDYYVDRQLANMAAEGVIDAKTAETAMIERQGEAYDAAYERVRYETSLRTPGLLAVQAAKGGGSLVDIMKSIPASLLSQGLLPEGELKQRGLSQEYSAAWDKYNAGDKKALNQFFDDHPEYNARLALYDEPAERLRQFLVSEIWDKYGELEGPNKKLAREQLPAFEEAFYDPNTRDYESIDVETLSYWARMLGGMVPETEQTKQQEVPLYMQGQQGVELYSDALAQEVQTYWDERGRLFPNILAVQSAYYDQGRDKNVLEQFPELRQYWTWKKEYEKAHPLVVKYNEEQKARYAEENNTVEFGGSRSLIEESRLYLTVGELEQFVQPLIVQLAAYYYTDKPITNGAREELYRLWEDNGKPGGTFETYLDFVVRSAIVDGIVLK